MYKKVLLLSLYLTSTLAAQDDLGFRYITKVYDDCKNKDGILPCLKKKAILFFDRAARMQVIPLVDGVNVVRTTSVDTPAINEVDIDAVLPRNLDKNEALTDMLWDRVAAFANSRTIQLSLPKMSGHELNKGVEEGNYILLIIRLKTFYSILFGYCYTYLSPLILTGNDVKLIFNS